MQKTRVGILGCGFIGGRHAKALAGIPDVVIQSLCDSDQAAAERLAAQLTQSVSNHIPAGGPKLFTEFGEMVASGIDAVFICLPPFAHTNEVELAAKAGVHLFIEKPISLSESAADAMVEAAEDAGIVTQVGYMMRFSSAVSRLRSLLDEGVAGKPTLFQATYSCNALHAPWWRRKEKSGGQIFEQAIHLYDLALHFMGRPMSVSGAMANLSHQDVDGYTIEDTSSAVVSFEGGSIASLSATNCAVPGVWDHSVSIVFEHLVAHIRNGTSLELTFTGGESVATERHEFSDDLFASEDAAFIASVRSGTQSAVPLSVGRDGIRLASAAVRAAESQAVVHL